MPLPAAAYASSNFLTTPAGQGMAAAAGGVLGGLFGKGPSIAKQMRDHRMLTTQNYKLQKEYGPQRYAIQHRAKDAKRAGLHPLAALGISTGSGGPAVQGNYIPGQNNTGSAIETGIKTMLNAKQSKTAAAYARSSQRMAIEEQVLRNEWLQAQIDASKVKTMGNLANTSRDAIALKALVQGAVAPKPGQFKVKPADRYPHTQKDSGYSLFGHIPINQRPGKLTVEGAEDATGELGALLYSPFSVVQDIGYTLDLMLHGGDRFGARREPIIKGGPQP